MTFGVLEAGQPADAKPETFLPKHAARRLVRRGWAQLVSKTVIRRFAMRQGTQEEPLEFGEPGYIYPVQLLHPELQNIPGMRYPVQLAQRNLETTRYGTYVPTAPDLPFEPLYPLT
jgi:hypothetical protein